MDNVFYVTLTQTGEKLYFIDNEHPYYTTSSKTLALLENVENNNPGTTTCGIVIGCTDGGAKTTRISVKGVWSEEGGDAFVHLDGKKRIVPYGKTALNHLRGTL
jgi:hypothetical protein